MLFQYQFLFSGVLADIRICPNFKECLTIEGAIEGAIEDAPGENDAKEGLMEKAGCPSLQNISTLLWYPS